MENAELTNKIERLFAVFSQLNIQVKTVEHPPIFTAQEGLFLHDILAGAHCKSLLLQTKNKKFILVVMREEPKLDLKKLATQLGHGRFSFAKIEDVRRLLGVEPGSLTPFGVMFDQHHEIELHIDCELYRYEFTNFHPLSNTKTVQITPEDLDKFFEFTGHQAINTTLPILGL